MPLAGQKLAFNANDKYIGNAFTNASGGASLTYNTTLLGPDAYELYSIWHGGPKYNNISASSKPQGLNLNVYAQKTTSVTTTVAATTTTNSAANQSSSSQPASAQNSSVYIYIGALVVIIIVVGIYVLTRKKKKPTMVKQKEMN